MKNIEVFEFLNQKYPLETAMEFDNPGFLVGDRQSQVTKILVALDCDRTAVEKAVELGCNLIVTHHPVIFSGLKSVTENSVVYSLIKNGISVISMHTNLDIAEGGVNDNLCTAVGLENVTVHTARDGYLLRKGEICGMTASKFAEHIQKALGMSVRFADSGALIKNVLVCSGSGGDYIYELERAGCDALLTADVKHNIFVDAVNMNVSVFDAGHFASEDVCVEPLASVIRGQFSQIEVVTHHPKNIFYSKN